MTDTVNCLHQLISSDFNKAAETHGFFTGLICIERHLKDKFWFESLLSKYLANHTTLVNRTLFVSLYTTISLQLEELDTYFELLLPPDTESLSTRFEAMTHWGIGFLKGINLLKLADHKPNLEDITHYLKQFAEITKLNSSNTHIQEEDEKAYHELIRYISLVIIEIYEKFNTAIPANTDTENSEYNSHESKFSRLLH